METRAHYAIIGAFTLAVIGAVFGFVLWIAGGTQLQAQTSYRVIFKGSVAGLGKGASVTFNGLTVGAVKSLSLMRDNPGAVQAIIAIDGRTPVKTDTHAELSQTGLTGVASVALSGGSANAPPLRAKEPGELPEIKAEASEIQSLLTMVQTLSKQSTAVLDKANTLLGSNIGAVQQSINNIQIFTKTLADNSAGVGAFLKSTAALGKSLAPLGPRIDKLTNDVDGVVNAVKPDDVTAIIANVKALTEKLNKTSDKLDALVGSAQGLIGSKSSAGTLESVSAAATALRKLALDLDRETSAISVGLKRFSGEGLRQYQGLAEDGRHTLDEINKTVRSLRKNPSQLIFGARPSVPEYPSR
ncbi:MAG: MCE family protein [Hyphomicrobiales bacterium]|nr:MCE family protein [Hyphomicrobiales bacterium]